MKKNRSVLILPALIVILFASCFKVTPPPQQTCNYDPCAYKVPDSQITAVKNYLDSIGVTATQHCSGMFYKIDDPGTGVSPIVCDSVAVTYKGKFTNGTTFDSSNTAIKLYLAGVIQGWANGVPLIKEGGKITLYIPP